MDMERDTTVVFAARDANVWSPGAPGEIITAEMIATGILDPLTYVCMESSLASKTLSKPKSLAFLACRSCLPIGVATYS